MFSGVWCTPELQTAVAKGYSIAKIYEVYHYKELYHIDKKTKTGVIFTEQINLFSKIKTEASGFPNTVVTEEDRKAFSMILKKTWGYP